jgi:hypothetical protein
MFSYPQPEPIKRAYQNDVILEKSTLGYATNNVHPQLPPRMNDGRSLIASHQPEAILNETILQNNNIKSNWEYRKFLTENSQKIAQENFREACNDVGYTERFTPDERGYKNDTHNTPSNYLLYKDQSTIINEKSDLKNLYLSRDELNSHFKPVSLTQNELFSNLAK